MIFQDREEAGKLLAEKLVIYKQSSCVIYAIPRGGVVLGSEIAEQLSVPLDLIITRKVGHPMNPEYAIAAISENRQMVGNKEELALVDKTWFQSAIEEQKQEAKRRRQTYLENKNPMQVAGKIAILVDDGIATGLTMLAAIKELRDKNPQKIIVAIPVIPKQTFRILQQKADQVIALDIPSDDAFLGAVGAYYRSFPAVSDEEVISLLKKPTVSTNDQQ